MRFTHDQLSQAQCFGFELPTRDYGPYELLPHTGGTPEGGNFDGGFTAGVNQVHVAPWTRPGALGEWSVDQVDEVYNRLIHLTGLESLARQGQTPEQAQKTMGVFWSLDTDEQGNFWVMKDCEMVAEGEEDYEDFKDGDEEEEYVEDDED